MGSPTVLGPQLTALASATGQLTGPQLRLVGGLLERLARLDRRQSALCAACRLLDPKRELSRWSLAIALETALARFAAVGARRVQSGARPATVLEQHLMVLLSGGARSANRLWEEIRDAGLPARR